MTIHSPGGKPDNHVTHIFLDIMLFLEKNSKFNNVEFQFESEEEFKKFRRKDRKSNIVSDTPAEFIKSDTYKLGDIDYTDVTALVKSVLDKYSDSITYKS